MKRNVSLDEISDGRLYDENDMVKVGCNDCRGCSDCCRQVGDTVILDPLDVFRLSVVTGESFDEMLSTHIDLGVVDGMVLPHLKVDERCTFLNDEGRCSIHPYRPGFCRMFPLGRYYENGTYRYFIQTMECSRKDRTKVKVSKWIDMPNGRRYKEFVISWHDFLTKCEDLTEQAANDGEKEAGDEFIQNLNMYMLELFYRRPYAKELFSEDLNGFYTEFEVRLHRAQTDLGIAPHG